MEGWPIFFKDNLIVGNIKADTALCTLWTKKEEFLFLPKDKYSVIGNLYTSYGINPMIKNMLANPRIKRIIICGNDLTKTGDIIVNFIRHGVDEDYKVRGCDAYIEKSIPKNLIDVLRKNVEVVDLRGAKNVYENLKDVLRLSKEASLYARPTIIKDEEKATEETSVEDSAFRVEGSIPEVWLNLLDIVLKFGEVKDTEYGIRQKELLNVISVITHDGNLPEWMPVTREKLEKYHRTFFSARQEEGVEYTYGERLFGLKLNIFPKMMDEARSVLNQVDLAVKMLRKKSFTRRAVAVTWRHEKDTASENPPCLVEVVWSVKFGKLYQTCTFRSHDIWGAYLLNVFALRKLQVNVAKRLGIPAGKLEVLSISAHIYENDWKNAMELVKRYHAGRTMNFVKDPRGYFIIKLEEGKIIAEHRLNDGRKTSYSFEGTKSEEMYRRILNENLVSRLDHAAYLGKELARAEYCLKNRIPYEQDKA